MGFLSKGWKGRGISQGPALHPQWGMTRNSSYFLFSHPKRYNYRDLCGIHLIPINKNSNRHCTKLITKHLCFHHNREHSVLELAAKDAAAPRKGAGKKKKILQTCSLKAEELPKWLDPFPGPNGLASEGPRANCHIQHCQPITKLSALSTVCFPPFKKRGKIKFKYTEWKKNFVWKLILQIKG